jgi:uncharacterized protein with ParB-like and HNH nuclease domain
METAIKIRDILCNDSYIIPRYQRNYAWEKKEISQLIRDINEYFQSQNNEAYYLGSLVCFKREDGFELIDGQQRHTTITLINLVLKNRDNIRKAVSKSNLKFDSRKKVQNYIEKLYDAQTSDFEKSKEELNSSATANFKVAIEIIQEEFRQIEDIQKFADDFYEKTYLFRVEVPEDTDLNHYFEIMNSRGEQLEKHEIVKSLLMGKIEEKNKELVQNTFAEIWDACSDMSDYVWFNFNSNNRQLLFDNFGNLKSFKFEDLVIKQANEDDSKMNLEDILKNENRIKYKPQDNSQNNIEVKSKYKSVIDFPNFLLQVLKLESDSVSLDDKKLLEHFRNNEPDPKKFIVDLLKYRTLFDKYIIKQDLSDADEDKQNWGIRQLNTDFETTIKTFTKTFEDDEELVKLQVMLYYSNSTNTYNKWLQEILKNENILSNLNDYTLKVFEIAKSKFDKSNLSYPNISIFNLYFIDFLLWKQYKEEVRGEENDNDMTDLQKKIFKQRSLFNSFKFKQISSREHLLSQEHSQRYNIDSEIYNGIGNLCLISTSQNSKGNKENPSDKKKMFQGDNSSLKRLIMFESFENDKWEVEQINKHKEQIIKLLNMY